MTKWIARILPLLWCCVAAATEVHDAPIPDHTNWGGIAIFALVFFGFSAGFVYMVWRSSRNKNDEAKPDA